MVGKQPNNDMFFIKRSVYGWWKVQEHSYLDKITMLLHKEEDGLCFIAKDAAYHKKDAQRSCQDNWNEQPDV